MHTTTTRVAARYIEAKYDPYAPQSAAGTPSRVARRAIAAAPTSDVILDVVRDFRRDVLSKVTCSVPSVFRPFDGLHHPLSGNCRDAATALADRIDMAVGEPVSRVVGGWFRKADQDYYYPSDWITPTPRELVEPGEYWKEHWWVEAEGIYYDVTADQFFPSNPERQAEHAVVVTPKGSGMYHPYRRRPLGKVRRLTPALEQLANKVVSLRTAQGWGFGKGAGYSKSWRAEEWFQKQGPRYGLSPEQLSDLAAVMRHESTTVDFTDIASVRQLLMEIV